MRKAGKNLTASEMGKQGGPKRMASMTPEERRAFARSGSEAARRKRLGLPPETARHWCLFIGQEDGNLRLEFSHQDKETVRQFARDHKILGFIRDVEYKPTLIRVVKKFGNDTTKQIAALERNLEQ